MEFNALNFALLSLFWTSLAISHENERPNFLIILADDLGWGDVSFHGSQQIPTPNIDILASTGVVLNNYYVSRFCSPSRSALLTGRHPIRTGMQVDVLAASEPYGLPLNFTTMGQHFQKIGYQTHLVGKWHLGCFSHRYLPTRRGFDSFFGYLTGHSDYWTRDAGDRFRGFDLRENESKANLSEYAGQYSTEMYTDRVIKLIELSSEKPWLIYMAQQSVHAAEYYQPIQPPSNCHEENFKHIKNQRRRQFAEMVGALDDSVGRVFNALNATGQLDKTIIVFSSDNGAPTAGINGHHMDDSMGSNWPLKGSKSTIWEGGVRATAFFWSSKFDEAHVSNKLMHITDILPTLYRLAGGTVSQLGDIDGIDQWSALNEKKEKDNYKYRKHLLHNIDHSNDFFAVRYRNYKLTSGSVSDGIFDNWFMAPGQDSEHAANGICYNCTTTYRIIQQRKLKFDPLKIEIDCNSGQNAMVVCNSTNLNEMCLFDVERDPCERTNLIHKKADVAKKILQILEIYDQAYAQPANKPSDPNANPALRDGFWGPWLDESFSEKNEL